MQCIVVYYISHTTTIDFSSGLREVVVVDHREVPHGLQLREAHVQQLRVEHHREVASEAYFISCIVYIYIKYIWF